MSASFPQLFSQEWTRFWSSKKRLIAALGIVVAVVGGGALYVTATRISCDGPNGKKCPPMPVNAVGKAVNDNFYFVHKQLAGNGSITARLTSLSGLITYPPPNHDKIVTGVVPWAKVGLIVKNNLKQGSSYASIAATGDHGVRMQYNYTEDAAGKPCEASVKQPRWLRLERAGQTLTGYESPDGKQWSKISSAQITDMPETVEVGLFAASPCDLTEGSGFLSGPECRFASATGSFDNITVQGDVTDAAWAGEDIGIEKNLPAYLYGKSTVSDGVITLTGSGDISPLGTDGSAKPIEGTLASTFIGVIMAIWLAARFGADRGKPKASVSSAQQVLASAMAAGGALLVVGLVGAGAAMLAGWGIMIVSDTHILPVATTTILRIVSGTALLIALSGVFTTALQVVVKSRRATIAIALSLVVLPYVLALVSALPPSISSTLMRVTPAAAFAVQQSVVEYPQVLTSTAVSTGHYPIGPWIGLGVLGLYAVAVLLPSMRRTS